MSFQPFEYNGRNNSKSEYNVAELEDYSMQRTQWILC